MPLATYTVGDGLLMVLEFALLFLWVWIAVGVIWDVFRSHDLSNGAKALWLLFIFVLPFIGVLAYMLVRGHTMNEHRAQDQAQYTAFRQFVAGPGAGSGPVADLSKLADLKDRGVLTDEEFSSAKAKLLAQ